ncbi:hypothetical protein RQP46_003614 [Phenoliferia psychrophenolica]
MSIFGAAAKPAEVKDVEVKNIQADSVSSISFAPNADYLAVASWSNEVRIFQVGQGGQSEGKAQYTHEAPVLCVDWSKDGTKVFSGGADNAGRIYDVATSQATQFAAHDAPVKCVRWVEINGQGVIATGSWDKTLKYWDLRSPTAVATVNLPERCYTLDVAGSLMVAGTAEKHVSIFNLSNPTTIFKTSVSPLRYQTRAIACIPDGSGYAIGSIEGRVAIQHIDDSKTASNFSFKCHRKDTKTSAMAKSTSDVFAVNCLSFHPLGSLATGGGDSNGTVNIWDHYSRTRLKTFSDVGGNVADTAFSHTGQYLAYAVSYDWYCLLNLYCNKTMLTISPIASRSKGVSPGLPSLPNKVMIHTCLEDEVRRRQKK